MLINRPPQISSQSLAIWSPEQARVFNQHIRETLIRRVEIFSKCALLEKAHTIEVYEKFWLNGEPSYVLTGGPIQKIAKDHLRCQGLEVDFLGKYCIEIVREEIKVVSPNSSFL